MKKYISRVTKRLAFLSIISVTVLIAGIVFIVAEISNIGLQFALTMLGGLMSILFLSCFFAEKSRALTIDSNKIILPRGAFRNGKISFQKIIINKSEIRSIKSELQKGDGIIAKDVLFHTLMLEDGTTIKFTLYNYGKTAEDEILKTIKKHI